MWGNATSDIDVRDLIHGWASGCDGYIWKPFDMTLLVADDSLAFVNLLKGWGKSEEYIHDLMKSRIDERTRFIRRAPIGHPELPADADDSKNELVAVFPFQNSVAFFHFENEEQLNLTYDAVLFKEVDI